MYLSKLILHSTKNVLQLNEIDAVVFNHLFNEQRVVINFDEFDKIDGKSKENCLKIFKYCEEHSATIWVSTRPSNQKVLQHNLKNPKIFKLSEFSKSDTEKFLEFFDENREADILEFLEKVGKVGNPKMIHEITEIFESHENISNWYLIYSQLILNRNFERSAKAQETSDIREALSLPQKLLKAHQIAALNYLFPHEILKPLNLTTESTDMLESYEIIYKNSENETKFIHESFAAYFVAQYFAENLLKIKDLDIKSDDNWKLLIEATKLNSWRIIEKILKDFIEINKEKLDLDMILYVSLLF